MNIIFLPIQPFVWHPGRIAAMAGIFLLIFVLLLLSRFHTRKLNPWPMLIPTVGWSLFALWEAHCMAREYNIRVDLLFVSPVLLFGTLAGIAGIFVRASKNVIDGKVPPITEDQEKHMNN
jgi:hypothetical protein